MGNQYTNDSKNELQQVAKALIKKYHIHLEDANLAYLWRENETKDKGETQYGEVRKTNDLLKHYIGADFLVSVYRYGWDKYLLPDRKVALMDNLLSHCRVALDKDGFRKEDKFGDPVWQMTKPDATMFYEVVRRHGPWNDSLKAIYSIISTDIGKEGEQAEAPAE